MSKSGLGTFAAFFRKHPPAANYLFGRHTKRLLSRLNQAVADYREGRSTRLIVNFPPQHGKTDIISRRFAAYLLLAFKNFREILASYSADAAASPSLDARRLVEELGEECETGIDPEKRSVREWRLTNGSRLIACGVGGGATGNAAQALLIDDYCGTRLDAESPDWRNRIWDCWRSDLRTRLAPVYICIILANRWHLDDLVGRILLSGEDWEVMNFPAQDSKTGKYLFTERYPAEWYEAQKRAIGAYAWQCQYLGNPVGRGGVLFCADRARETPNAPRRGQWRRGWYVPPAGEEGWTVGTLSALRGKNILVRDVIREKASGPDRERLIFDAARRDGTGVEIIVGAVGGYHDLFRSLRRELIGHAKVRLYGEPREGLTEESAYLQKFFSASRILVPEGAAWLKDWRDEFRAFPVGASAEQVESLVLSTREAYLSGLSETNGVDFVPLRAMA